MTQRIINAVAPTRICDIGGWTDTWFAGHGAVLSIAVQPNVEVQLIANESDLDGRIVIEFENYGERHEFDISSLRYDHHPLIQAALDVVGVPAKTSVQANIYSSVPPGASTGTSAALSVALVAALDRLNGGTRTAHELAATAHALETEKLRLQSGVQDQLASAYGGINYLEITDYPHTSVSPVVIPDALWWELENRLALAYIGKPHSSSKVHEQVIKELGSDAESDPRIVGLRETAARAKTALLRGSLSDFADSMNQNTLIQRAMHPELVSAPFEQAIAIAREYGAEGFKVNGAGGDGGTLTILSSGSTAQKRRMEHALAAKGFEPIPISPARSGARTWEPEFSG